jgi:hypothetical protein
MPLGFDQGSFRSAKERKLTRKDTSAAQEKGRIKPTTMRNVATEDVTAMPPDRQRGFFWEDCQNE